MAEFIGIASGLLTLINTTVISCKALYKFVNDFKEASIHMRMILSDLQDLENVLATLEALLRDEDLIHGVIFPTSMLNLKDVLSKCNSVLEEINTQLKELQRDRNRAIQEEIRSLQQRLQKEQRQDRNKEIESRLQELHKEQKSYRHKAWDRLKWTFKKEIWEDLRERLVQCKLTLNLTISVANFYNTYATSTKVSEMRVEIEKLIRELETKLPTLVKGQEEIKAAYQSGVPLTSAVDLRGVESDHSFVLRKYLEDTVSFVSGTCKSPSGPSMQISSLCMSATTNSTAFVTSDSQLVPEPCLDAQYKACTQLFIKGLFGRKTLILQVRPQDNIEEVVEMIARKVECEAEKLELSYPFRKLEPYLSLETLGIQHNSTLNIVRPWTDKGERLLEFVIAGINRSVFITTLLGESFHGEALDRLQTKCFLSGIHFETFDHYSCEGFDPHESNFSWPYDGGVVRVSVKQKRRKLIKRPRTNEETGTWSSFNSKWSNVTAAFKRITSQHISAHFGSLSI